MPPLLSRIHSPADLKNLSAAQLTRVADEIRLAIMDNLSKTGGHYASDLGAVEIILAMHRVYDVPKDKVIWDTGHQCYGHKMLTGRLDRFETLRQYRGLSGFLSRAESDYDLFGAGHAGTSISAAYGFAVARDMAGRSNEESVLAVIGDAAMTAGLALEGLHNAGHSGRNFTVVLNDNDMSIAESVGALATYLAKLRVTPLYQSMEAQTRDILKRVPGTPGRALARAASSVLKHNLTHLVAPENAGLIFEELGYEYIGPVDGHNLSLLIDLFTQIKQMQGPVFVHLITTKGKGDDRAEENARKWHAVTPPMFQEAVVAAPASAGPAATSWTNVFSKTLIELADHDPTIVGITAAMPDGTGLNKFKDAHPDRYFDTAIAEQHAVCFAAGLAAAGQKPVAAIYSTFLQRSYDMIVHDVCIQNLPVLFCLDRAGLVGDDGPTHHGVFDIAYLRPLPNMTVLAPKDGAELAAMLRYMVQEHVTGERRGPIAVRYPRGNVPAVDWDRDSDPIALGRAETILEGDDLYFLAYGSMVAPAFDATRRLREAGVSAGLINLRWAKPLDTDTILYAARRAGRVIVAEEGVIPGGVGSGVLETLAANGVWDAQVRLCGVPDQFIEHGSVPILHGLCKLRADDLADAARELLGVPAGTMKAAVAVTRR